jgi:hypothetical protein
MLVDAGECMKSLVAELAQRVRIEPQPEGWAVIVDGVVWTWAVSEQRACDTAVQLIELGN